MELKIEDVKAGDKYKLTTPALKGFVLNDIYTIEKIVGEYIRFKNATDPMYFENLVYFKKVEQSQQYALDDLIDVAVQAYKDGVATVKIDTKLHTVFVEELKTTYGIGHIDLGIKNIQSLYTETFVIESEEDIDRVNADAVIVLSNGSEMTEIVTKRKDSIEFSSLGVLYFYILKGATVTQKRGK